MTDAQTKLFALLGNPVGHSLSPLLQNYFLAQTGFNGAYLAFAPQQASLGQAVQGLSALGIGGANVTIPYKEAIMPHLLSLTKRAELCQAVNTLIPTEDGFIGDNTDGDGLLTALVKQYGYSPKGQRVLLIGAGGAAKGVAVALALGGAAQIVVVNRSMDKALALTELLRATATQVRVMPWAALADGEIYQALDLIINTTPLGMHPQVDAMPPVAVNALQARHLVVDLIYNPPETELLRQAKARGAKTASGLGMLIEQGALSFAQWIGVMPPSEGAYPLLAEALVEKNKR